MQDWVHYNQWHCEKDTKHAIYLWKEASYWPVASLVYAAVDAWDDDQGRETALEGLSQPIYACARTGRVRKGEKKDGKIVKRGIRTEFAYTDMVAILEYRQALVSQASGDIIAIKDDERKDSGIGFGLDEEANAVR